MRVARLQATWPSRLGFLVPMVLAGLVACGDGGSAIAPQACLETGPFACTAGESEPLYAFQWALNYDESWFAEPGHADEGAWGGGMDLNVEPVHRQSVKGQGVNVLVIDSGVELEHEDLADNAEYGMSWNFETGAADPNPLLTGDRRAHGTNVAGVIAAAQNGKGVMGIAPRARLGGAALILANNEVQTLENYLDAYGGADWSRKAHVMNASFGGATTPERYSIDGSPLLSALRGLKDLRGGKGIVFVKAAGNEFDGEGEEIDCGPLKGAYNCINPANDSNALEPNVILAAALNAKGWASGYSSAGSVVWVTGMGGEYGREGQYGEASGLGDWELATGATGDGPTLFSTDIQGCSEGDSQTVYPVPDTPFMRGESERIPGIKDNPSCDYGYMNGTSAATPTISGLATLVLSVNPELTWRDVRDILRLSARQVDMGYEGRTRLDDVQPQSQPFNALFDLQANRFVEDQEGSADDIRDGSTQVPVELGWVQNHAGLLYSNRYGFGVPDAARAVELARLYRKEPDRSRPAMQDMGAFEPVADVHDFEYQKVSLLGEFSHETGGTVDQFQVRLDGQDICLGSLGIAVQSPAGTKSLLKMPLDHFVHLQIAEFDEFGLGSYAFYGEQAQGTWKIYAVASNPLLDGQDWSGQEETCDAAPADGVHAAGAVLTVEARIIAQ